VTRKATREAVAYSGVKRNAPKKTKRFDCEFAFRDGERLIRVVSRPGVFSHRRLDLGARALIESLADVDARGRARSLVPAGASVLDLGCGAGAVGFAAALRAGAGKLHAVDSMPRAIECARRGAESNALLERFTAQATALGASDVPIEGAGSFDLVLGNPPYYSQHAIAELFVRAALVALKPGGRVHFVTRQPEWFAERMARDLRSVRVRELRTYSVASGVRASV
jgi:16S rRNA (guanine1207-N2)-methyltransferase